MTKIEKAKEIIRQGGACINVACDNITTNSCVCFEWCKSNNCIIGDPKTHGARKRIEICEKYLKESAMEKQLFDKSKVLVAGIHDIEAGKRYYVSNDIDNDSNYCLRRYVENKNERQIQTLECYREGKYRTPDGYYAFAYPYEEPVKTWRPIKTIEEAEQFLGKKIKSKDGKEKMLLTECFLQDSGSIKINKASPKLLFDCYLQENGSPVGIEE